MMNRISAATAAWMLMFAGTTALEAADPVAVQLTIRADTPGATIDANIYGQFMEHLGRNVYEGIWVGENSTIPNTRGFRNDTLAALKKLKVPVLRWPGGCFADEYHWRDGIGERAKRPHRVNTFWGGVIEPNEFGTHEFFELAEMLGAKTYLAVNVGSGTVEEMSQWVEYITSPSQSTLANERRKNGRDKPWKLDYVGVGNEPWGCGGDMRPEYYADEYKKYALNIKAPPDNRPVKVASGPYGDGYEWTEVLMKNAVRQHGRVSHCTTTRCLPAVSRRRTRARRCRSTKPTGASRSSTRSRSTRCIAQALGDHGQARSREEGRACMSTSGARGTTWSRAPTPASCSSRTPCAMPSSRDSISTSSTNTPTACA